MGRVHRGLVLLGAGIVAVWLTGGRPVWAARLFQAAPWQVTRVEPKDGSGAFCRATAPMALPIDSIGLFRATFDVHADGRRTLTAQIDEPVPAWMDYGSPQPSSGEETIRGCRFWFDDRALWPMDYVWDHPTGIMRYDLSRDRQFLEELATARYLKLETKPGSMSEVRGERVFQGEGLHEYSFVNTAGMVQQLNRCLASVGETNPVAPVTVYERAAAPVPLPAPMPQRLAAARLAVREVPAGDADGLALAFLRLGEAAADALRLGEARDAFEGLRAQLQKGVALTPALRRGLERYVAVLVLSERLDTAFAVANTLPDKDVLLAAIALARGDYTGAEQWICAAGSRILGRPIRNWMALSDVKAQDFRMELWGRLGPAMRRLFLLWSMAALGQEKVLVSQGCGNCVVPANTGVPAMAAASQIANWVQEDMLREGAPDTPAARRDLGIGAFLRGDSLLRAGYLVTVQSEFRYALFELDGPSGAEGWLERTRVAQAGLAAAEGRAFDAFAAAQKAAAETEASVGRESLPWIEAAALESEAARRIGDNAASVALAQAGLTAARACLPEEHSLVYRLKRSLGQALLGLGQAEEAGRTLSTALGMDRIPSFSQDRLESLATRLAQVPLPALRPPKLPRLDAAGIKQAGEEARHRLQQVRQSTRERYTIMANSLGLPDLTGKLSVAASEERLGYSGPLFQLKKQLSSQEEVTGVDLLRQTLGLEALRGTFNPEGTQVNLQRRFVDELAQITRGTSVLDVHGPSLPGESASLPLQMLSGLMSTSAADWLSLANMFPGERRMRLVPGEVLEGLERYLDALHTLWQQPPEAKDRQRMLAGALVVAQAATRGEVLANILTRAQLVGDPRMPEEYRHYCRQAIEGDLWLRRQRGALLDAAATHDPLTPRLSAVRVRARRLDLSNPYHELAVFAKFFEHVFAPSVDPNKGFETLTWFGAVKYEFKLDQVQKRLGPDDAFVVWLPLEKSTHVFVLRNTACDWQVIPEGQAVWGRHIRAIRESIEAVDEQLQQRNGHPETVSYPADAAHALYAGLFGAIGPALAGVTHLYTAQLGVVGGIPLGLLVTQPPVRGQAAQWLADRFAITRVPALVNADIFKTKTPSRPPKQLLLAAGDPLVGGASSPAPKMRAAAIRSVNTLDANLQPLPETRQEMDRVAKLLGLPGGGKNPYLLAGAQATPQHILQALRHNDFKYLLFATHGLALGRYADEPCLVLSPRSGARRPDDDGLLRASDIVGLDLNTDLVILSACDTAPSGEDGAEPLAGLASAFLVAGARSVLSTQWVVASNAAQAVSTNMVAAIRAGQRPSRALQQAVRDLRENKGTAWAAHPAYWAPYELVAFPQ